MQHNNCKSKSLVNDSNDGTLQLAVLRFWTLYTVWCSEQNALLKLDLFLYTGKNGRKEPTELGH